MTRGRQTSRSPAAATPTRRGSSADASISRCAIYTRRSVVKRKRKRRSSTADASAEEIFERGPLGSCEAQRELCEALVLARGWVALEQRYEDDGFSGATTRRPGLAALLEDVEAGLVDRIVVYRIDRLSRSLIDFVRLSARLSKLGVGLVSVAEGIFADSADGRFHLGLTLLLAQRERELAGERTADRAAVAKRKGLCTGEIPYGSRLAADGVSLEDDPDEQAAIQVMRELAAQGRGARAIATALGKRGFAPRGRSWHATTVSRVLQRCDIDTAGDEHGEEK